MSSSHALEADSESEDGVDHERTSHSNLHKSSKTLRFRSVDNGYWVGFLLPGAIYISDLNLQRESATAVAIITYNVVLLCAFQLLQLNFYMLLHRLKNINYFLSGVVIGIVFLHGGKLLYSSLAHSYSLSCTITERLTLVYNMYVSSRKYLRNRVISCLELLVPLLILQPSKATSEKFFVW